MFRGIQKGDVEDLKAVSDGEEVFFPGGEGFVREAFAGAFGEDAPAVGMVGRVKAEAGGFLRGVKTERRIEVPGDGEIGDGESEVIEGMDAEFAGAAGGVDEAEVCRHHGYSIAAGTHISR